MSSKRLLIIEDDTAFASVLHKRLLRYGFEAQVAFDAPSALHLAYQWHPHFVILDMKLGNDSGLVLLPQLRQSLPQARIVLLTGYASIATAVQAVKQGADDYLAKPVETQSLLASLQPSPTHPDAMIAAKSVDESKAMMSPERLEWEHIQTVLAMHGGNISAAARAMNMHRRTLQRKLSKRPVKQ
ncbi:response regulator transcription factor [Echinimonas agarilytica]|uniref:Response regulator n=1 Tax=Echinimonas agarilytica TaxID=1215918 RepID=A0AA42B672_9GAMM|nr:response regulator [Echinimonas agarilytica]MCM2678146.1 response regulator [Echinimonas agarilytica]